MSEDWLQRHTPSGFKSGDDSRRMWMVRNDLEGHFSFEHIEKGLGLNPTDLLGRKKLYSLALINGEKALIRPYWHGGFFRHITRQYFFSWPPRPFAELIVTEHLRKVGVPVPEVLAACVRRDWGPFYRGWLISREILGAKNLWQMLQDGVDFDGEKPQLLRDLASVIRQMHQCRVLHGDLQLRNILVQPTERGNQIYLIDFDKAKIVSKNAPSKFYPAQLNRLLRSICKLDPHRRLITEEDWQQFVGFYGEKESLP